MPLPDTVCSAPPARQPHNDCLREQVRPIPPSKSSVEAWSRKGKKTSNSLDNLNQPPTAIH
jgi:hypothetical protein